MTTSAELNRSYLQRHVAKEDLFWTTYMGVQKDPKPLEQAELDYKSYLSDPKQLQAVRAAIAKLPANAPADERTALEGWRAFFEAHTIEGEEPQRLQREVVELESAMFGERAKVRLSFTNAKGEQKEGSTNVMASNIAAAADETVRKSSHQALLGLERWVLEHGFLELVKRRNAFARALGFPDYFSYSVMKKEQLSAQQVQAILEEFEELTRDANLRELERIAREKGKEALLGHNLKYAVSGDVEQKLDPYLPFTKSLERWYRSFGRLGITYRGATLSLDLLERKGKYENGFMHGPQPCYFDQGRWIPARINFTSNATPTQVGSGRRGLATFFHEGGHAAHFSNITMPAPCFSQEYPPTSMAYAETQSMFCDSLLNDADWLWLYAQDRQGQRMPEELIRQFLVSDQPFRAFQERSILLVPIFESRLYTMADSELTPASVLELARRCEKEILGIECSPRPLLAIPHLLGGDSACSYQGYLLAHMAVYQTRGHLLGVLGHLTDNPRVGPELARHYWNPGNSRSHSQTVESLTGKPLSGRMLADSCNQSPEELWRKAEASIREAQKRGPKGEQLVDLDARIQLVHGAERYSSNERSAKEMFEQFEAYVEKSATA